MTITTLSSREFSQNTGRAKQAAEGGPVIITDRGHPSHVLLTFAAYKKLASKRVDIADLLALPRSEGVELTLTRAKDLARSADLF